MQTWTRYLILVGTIIIGFHFILQITDEDYGRVTSFSHITSHFKDKPNIHPFPAAGPFFEFPSSYLPSSQSQSTTKSSHPGFPAPTNDIYLPPSGVLINQSTLVIDRRANATFVILARNTDVDDVIRSIREIEDRFNRNRGYPYVFLNDEPFTDEFKKRVSVLAPSLMEFGQIPHDHWFQPEWIDETRAQQSRKKMAEDHVIYGDSVSYRNMCRFNSGFFFRHPLMQKYRWYWRIEPRVRFHCNIDNDPFLYMEDNDKVYGFTIALYEYEQTIQTLWSHVREFMVKYPRFIAKNNSLGFLSHDQGNRYNLCHFWSNFEIADMNFWRGEAYTKFFEYLDSQGGFYYERWGDAPVHSIAAGLFARRDQIHFFDEIGYEHPPYTHCPKDPETWKRTRCSCNDQKSFDYTSYSCLKFWEALIDGS